MQSLFSYNISLSLVLMAVSVFAFIIAVFYFPYAPSAASTNFQIVYWTVRFLLGLGGIAGFIIGFEGFDTTMRAELK